MKISVLLFTLFTSLASFAQPDDVYFRERDLEEKINQLAQVQFGSEDVVAVRVQAVLVKRAPASEKPSADVGYLPLPYNENGTKEALKEEIDGYDVNIMASSRANKTALQNFQLSVRRLLAPKKSKVSLQIVQFDDVNDRKPASEPVKPAPEKEKDSVTSRDYLYGGVFFLSILVGSILVLFGIRMLGRALKFMAEVLESSLKFSKSEAKTVNKLPETEKKSEDSSYRKNENISQAMNMRQSVETLRKYCHNDPLKLVQSLGDGIEDVLGLRWLLSQLADEERKEMRNFLGDQKIRSLSKVSEAPQGFNVMVWAQALIERVSLRKLDAQSQLERALSNNEISYLYRIPALALISFSQRQRDPRVWKLALEVIPDAELASLKLTNEDWNLIIEGQKVSGDEFKAAFELIKTSAEIETSMIGVDNTGDDKTHSLIVPNMISSLKVMKIHDEYAFLDELKERQEKIYESIRRKFWSYRDLPMMNQDRLRTVVAGLSNETLFAVLLVAPEAEREVLKEMIPPGMKRSVVLDLTEKALMKGDEQEYSTALRIAREFFDSLVKMNETTQIHKELGVVA